LLRERSTEDLIQAIHSPGDEAFVLDRARVTLKLFFERDMSDLDKAEMLEEFGRALRDLPRWAVSQAFDRWNREQRRRPAPGDIVELAKQAMRRVTDELADRRREGDGSALPGPETDPRERAEMAERAKRILEEAGFTARRIDLVNRFPTARTVEEAEARLESLPPHWSKAVAPDGREMAALRAERAANPIMRAAMEDARGRGFTEAQT
jgi:hypothetical protein